MLIRIIFFSFFILFLSEVTAFSASAFRCGLKLVQKGDTSQEVTSKCGEPTSKEIVNETSTGYSSRKRYSGGSYSNVSQKVEVWEYNCGSNGFSMSLTFLGNTLDKIERLGYGSGQSYCDGADNNPNNKISELDKQRKELENEKLRLEINAEKQRAYQSKMESHSMQRHVVESRIDRARNLVQSEKDEQELEFLRKAIIGVHSGDIEAIQDYLDLRGPESIKIEQFIKNPDNSISVDFNNGNSVRFENADDFINKILTPLKHYE